MGYLESVDNALRLLLLLAREGQLGVTEAAVELGVAPSTAHRLLSTLRYRGFVLQDPSRGYRPGPAFAALGGLRARQGDLTALARPAMERLCRELEETCHLMVLEGRQVRFLASIEANRPLRIGSRTGHVMPAHLTSGGRVLLAELPGPELDARYPARGGEDVGLDADGVRSLRRAVRSARQRGYGVNVGESERGIAAIGVAVTNHRGVACAALSVSIPTIRYSSARVPDVLVALRGATFSVAEELSAQENAHHGQIPERSVANLA